MSQEATTLLIPGPVRLSPHVQSALSIQSLSHTSPEFVTIYQRVLQNTRRLFKADVKKGLPIVLAGSGTLGFDLVGANLVSPKDEIYVISTGFFSDEFAECLNGYGANITTSRGPVGDIPDLNLIKKTLQENKFKLVVMTQVDTSTGVLNDVESICKLVRDVSPDSLIVVDGVCSIGCETLEFDKWGVDFCLTASQKAIGAPPGLSIAMISERALETALDNKASVKPFFSSLIKWSPILKGFEEGRASYFATPPVQLINSLDVALDEILEQDGGLDKRVQTHEEKSNWFKSKITNELGLELVSQYPQNDVSAHGLTAIYVNNPPQVISSMKSKGFVIAGGLYKGIASKYIRIGHMGYSVCNSDAEDIVKCYAALKSTLQE